MIAAGNDALLPSFTDAGLIGRDPRFSSNAARCTHVALLKRLIEAVPVCLAHWIAVPDAPGADGQGLAQALADPQWLPGCCCP